MKGKKATPLRTNAIIALFVLSAMFVGTLFMFYKVVDNASILGCSATEFGMGIMGMMLASIGGVVFVVKNFATRGME